MVPDRAAWVRCVLLALLLQFYTAAAETNRNETVVWTNPCSEHRCADGLQCVVHVIACLRPPCPRIGECVPVQPASCLPPCPPGYSCKAGGRGETGVCTASGDSGGLADACNGRCLNSDEECVSFIQPCTQPPCSVFSQCVARARHARAHTSSKSPGKPRLRRSGACVVPCSGAEQCRAVPAPCAQPPCPTIHRCIAASPAETAVSASATEGATSVHCLVPCASFEQCQLTAPNHCTQPPCQPIPRCMPRAVKNNNSNNHEHGPAPSDPCRQTTCSDGYRCVLISCADQKAPDQSDTRRCTGCVAHEARVDRVTGQVEPYCPVDTLQQLLGPGACASHQLNTCGESGGEGCGRGQRCCRRGCGRSCVPACRRACRTREQCQLVPISCLVPPCPTEAQCVFVGNTTVPATSTAAAPEEAHPFPPPVQPAILNSDQRWPLLDVVKRCGTVQCRSDQVCRPEWCSPPARCGTNWPLRLHCISAVPRRPGQCPVSKDSAPGCFTQSGVRDQCRTDFQCATGEKCCLQRCARRCVPACAQRQCADGETCQMDVTLSVSSCQP